MLIDIDFLTLREAFSQHEEGDEIKITVQQLSDILYCTPRNSKFIISKMKAEGWIQFIPGQGRGNSSTLIFLQGKEDILFQKVQRLIEHGDLEEGFELIKKFGSGTNIHHRIQQWFSGYFGHSIEGQTNGYEVLRFPVLRKLHTIDPAECYFSFDTQMLTHVYEPILDYDDETRCVKGLLAHTWESNSDKTTWTFYLRKGVFFHEGGELTASDVIYSFRRLMKFQLPQSWLLSTIKNMKELSRYVVEIELITSNPLFIKIVSHPATAIIPEKAFDPQLGRVIKPIGTGPFKLTIRSKEKFELHVNEQYFRERPHLDKIEVITLPLEEYPFYPTENEVMVDAGEAVHEGNSKDRYDYAGACILTMNIRKEGPLQEQKIRKMISLSINQVQMVNDLGLPRISPASGFFSSTPLNKVQSQVIGCTIEDTFTLYTYQRHEVDALWIKEQLSKIGIIVDVRVVEWGDLLDTSIVEKADFIIFEPVFGYDEISQQELFHHHNSFLHIHIGDEPYIIENLKPLGESPDHFQKVENYLVENDLIVFLCHKRVTTITNPIIKGSKVNRKGWINFKDVWFKRK